MNVSEAMLLVQAVAPHATIQYSEFTGKWYIGDDDVEIGGDGFLVSPIAQTDTPESAVFGFLEVIQAVKAPKYLVVRAMSEPPDGRRHYRWNGMAWAELPR